MDIDKLQKPEGHCHPSQYTGLCWLQVSTKQRELQLFDAVESINKQVPTTIVLRLSYVFTNRHSEYISNMIVVNLFENRWLRNDENS